jgi:amino acid transporter
MTAGIDAPALRRSLGLPDVAFFFVITGSNFQWIATAAAAGPSSIPVWLIGCGAMFVPLAIVVVYLSSRHPDEGGMYVWSARAFGPFAGFMTGWTYWVSNVTYFPALLYFMAGNALFVTGTRGGALATSPAYFIAAALAGLAFATALNAFGLGVGKWLNNIGAASRWIATLVLIGAGVVAWVRFGPATHFTVATMRPGLAIKDLIFWSVIAFAWTGPEAVSFMGGEIKRPRRTIPLGIALASPFIAIIYIAGTVAILAALQANQVDPTSGVMQTIAHVANATGMAALAPIAALLVALSCLGSCGAWLGTVARIPFVAGIDRYLPSAFGRLDPRAGSPNNALLVQSAITAIVIVLGQGGSSVRGAYDLLVSSTVIVTLLPFLALFASAFRLYGIADTVTTTDTVRIPGGRTTVLGAAALGFFTTFAAIVLAFFPADDEPHKVFAVGKLLVLTLFMVGSGIAIYASGRHRRAARSGIAA